MLKFYKEFLFVIIEYISTGISTVCHFYDQKREYDVIFMDKTSIIMKWAINSGFFFSFFTIQTSVFSRPPLKFGTDAYYKVSDALVVDFRLVPNDLGSFQDSTLFGWLLFFKFNSFKFRTTSLIVNYFLASTAINNIIQK